MTQSNKTCFPLDKILNCDIATYCKSVGKKTSDYVPVGLHARANFCDTPVSCLFNPPAATEVIVNYLPNFEIGSESSLLRPGEADFIIEVSDAIAMVKKEDNKNPISKNDYQCISPDYILNCSPQEYCLMAGTSLAEYDLIGIHTKGNNTDKCLTCLLSAPANTEIIVNHRPHFAIGSLQTKRKIEEAGAIGLIPKEYFDKF